MVWITREQEQQQQEQQKQHIGIIKSGHIYIEYIKYSINIKFYANA